MRDDLDFLLDPPGDVGPSERLHYFLDESIKKSGTRQYAAIIAVRTTRPNAVRNSIRTLMSEIVASRVLSEHNSINANWIPHFCKDHPFEVHQRVLEEIARLPVEAYIAFASKPWLELTEDGSDLGWYNHLFRQIISFRLRADGDRTDTITYEQHTENEVIRQKELQREVERLNPIVYPKITVHSASKEDLALCVSDYIGGAFMSYLCEEDPIKKESQMRRKYFFIQHKVRWIKNCETKQIFYSRNPFLGS